MSLEKALEANTAAVLALNESIQLFISNASIANDRMLAAMAKQDSVGMPTPKKQEEKVSAPSKGTSAPSAPAPVSTAAEPVAATSTSLTYDDIKKPFLELAKHDLAAAQALIAEFGFKTLKDAKPEQYAEILRALTPDEDVGMA